ncbi:MAG: hypothetical protein DLM68_07935 [Hyphomicrobiales bacterium]|nr:MAG: hypothetical protein DLM68_07935 [Hyphomicrobiales bacterium]
MSGNGEKGFLDIVLDGVADVQSKYVRHTAILSTVLTGRSGGAVRVTDFAPRFRQFGCVFRPLQLLRIVKPLAGLPRITCGCGQRTPMVNCFRVIPSTAL